MLVYRRVVTHFVVQPHPRRSRSSRLATAALTSWDKGLQTPDPSWAYFILKYEYEQIYSTISMYMLHVYIHIFRCIYIYILYDDIIRNQYIHEIHIEIHQFVTMNSFPQHQWKDQGRGNHNGDTSITVKNPGIFFIWAITGWIYC